MKNFFLLICFLSTVFFSIHSVKAMTAEDAEQPLTDSGYLRARPSNEETLREEEPKKKKPPKLLTNLKEHRSMLKRSIKHAEKDLTIMTSKVSERFIREDFIPWLITRAQQKKPTNLPKITICIREEEADLLTTAFQDACARLELSAREKEAFLKKEQGKRTKVHFKGMSPKLTSPERDIFRRFSLFKKMVELIFTNYSKSVDYGRSNVLIEDDRVFISTPCPWLSLDKTIGGLLPVQKNICYFAPVITGKKAKQFKENSLEKLHAILMKINQDQRAYSRYLKDFEKAHPLEEEEGEVDDGLHDSSASQQEPEYIVSEEGKVEVVGEWLYDSSAPQLKPQHMVSELKPEGEDGSEKNKEEIEESHPSSSAG